MSRFILGETKRSVFKFILDNDSLLSPYFYLPVADQQQEFLFSHFLFDILLVLLNEQALKNAYLFHSVILLTVFRMISQAAKVSIVD